MQKFETVGAGLHQNVIVALGQDDGQVSVEPPDLPAEIDAVHARHPHVGEYHVGATRILLQLCQRILGVGRPHKDDLPLGEPAYLMALLLPAKGS